MTLARSLCLAAGIVGLLSVGIGCSPDKVLQAANTGAAGSAATGGK